MSHEDDSMVREFLTAGTRDTWATWGWGRGQVGHLLLDNLDQASFHLLLIQQSSSSTINPSSHPPSGSFLPPPAHLDPLDVVVGDEEVLAGGTEAHQAAQGVRVHLARQLISRFCFVFEVISQDKQPQRH